MTTKVPCKGAKGVTWYGGLFARSCRPFVIKYNLTRTKTLETLYGFNALILPFIDLSFFFFFSQCTQQWQKLSASLVNTATLLKAWAKRKGKMIPRCFTIVLHWPVKCKQTTWWRSFRRHNTEKGVLKRVKRGQCCLKAATKWICAMEIQLAFLAHNFQEYQNKN